MKTKHLLLLISIVALCSCSSAFRTGQTPDDVYYSPAPPPPVEYVTTENQEDRDSYANHNDYNSEDLAIRRGISDPRYRSNLSLDLGYGSSPYDYYGSSLYSPYSSFYNPYTSYYNPYSYTGVTFFPHGYNYNYYGSYSPYSNYFSPFNNYSYYPPVYVSSPAANYSAGPRTFNLGAYNNTRANGATVRQQQSTTGTTMPVRTVTPRATTGTGVGNLIRRVIAPSDNNRSSRSDNDNNRSYRNDNYNNNNNNSAPTRSVQSNTSSGSSSSSSGSSSAPVRTFR